MQELRTIYQAARKLEGWSEEDFQNAQSVNDYVQQAQKAVSSVNKYKNVVEAIAFNIITKKSVDELDKKDDLIEYVGKVKRIASVMAEEFMEPDERLEKVAIEGRRLIEHFIDQWKKTSFEPKVEEIKEG
ncbi:MAG: hypothetical protein ACLUVC_14095 [Longibaculum sp.]